MRKQLATFVFLVAAAASLATSAPHNPGLVREQEIEPVRVDENEETIAFHVRVRFPLHDLEKDDLETASIGLNANIDPTSDASAIAKLNLPDAKSGQFMRLDRIATSGVISNFFELVCSDGFCAYEGTISFERVGSESALVGGTVTAAISWSSDVDVKAKTPLTEELEITIER